MVKEELKGIGGWLVFFIITLIISTLYLSYDILMGLSSALDFSFLSITLFIEVSIVVLFVMSIVYLFRENKKGVEILKWALWLPAFNVLILLIVFFILGEPNGEGLSLNVFQGVIYALIWTSYLRKSERVKNTYYKKKKT